MAKLSKAEARALKRALTKSGSKGGKKAAAGMTPEQLKARARKAVAAREAKRKERK